MKAVIFVNVQNDFITGVLKNNYNTSIYNNILKFATEHDKSPYAFYGTRLEDDFKKYGKFETSELNHNIPKELYKMIPSHQCVDMPTYCSYQLIGLLDNHQFHLQNKMNDKFDEFILVGFGLSNSIIGNAIMLRGLFPLTKITIIEDLCADNTSDIHNSAINIAKQFDIDVISVDEHEKQN